ncbi:MAG: hypothetical protein H8K07_19220 [Nitrospira sp.]|nr:hypothetical protein [Nitrospira sp.]
MNRETTYGGRVHDHPGGNVLISDSMVNVVEGIVHGQHSCRMPAQSHLWRLQRSITRGDKSGARNVSNIIRIQVIDPPLPQQSSHSN